jgi:phenylacetyl-CoA:acceptor oxidoreductase 26-kDa subunit
VSKLQSSWDARAAINFMLGGSGGGLMVAAALVLPPSPWLPALALALVAAGLAAVWLEIGKKWRALHVLFHPLSSWMTRESFAALVLFPLGIGAIALPEPWPLRAAGVAALAFVWCQARILRAAKAIPAWRAPEIVLLVVATGLAEGAGLCLFFDDGSLAVALFAGATLARAFAWGRYRDAAKNPALDPAGRSLEQLGTVLPLLLLLIGSFIPQAALAAGALVVATGWRLKLDLVTRAGYRQPFALPHLPVRGTR